MTTPAVEVRDVWGSYRERPVLAAIDLTLPRNDYVAVLGPNGSGKTTLMKVMLGLIQPERGTIRVLGVAPRAARGRIGYVPQRIDFDLAFPITVLDVVLMGRLACRGF